MSVWIHVEVNFSVGRLAQHVATVGSEIHGHTGGNIAVTQETTRRARCSAVVQPRLRICVAAKSGTLSFRSWLRSECSYCKLLQGSRPSKSLCVSAPCRCFWMDTARVSVLKGLRARLRRGSRRLVQRPHKSPRAEPEEELIDAVRTT